jgi:hypothetical protein
MVNIFEGKQYLPSYKYVRNCIFHVGKINLIILDGSAQFKNQESSFNIRCVWAVSIK